MKKFILFLPLLLFGKEVTLDFLASKPSSIAKDYYIYKFFDQNITSKEADIAFYQIKNVNKKLFLKYAKKTDKKEIKKVAKCLKTKKDEVLKGDESCIAIWITPYRFLKLDKKDKEFVLKKIKKFKFYKQYKILSANYPFELLLKNRDLFIKTFISVGDKNREKFFDRYVDIETLNYLKNQKNFDTFIKIAATSNLKKLHFSLFALNPKELSHQSNFFIAILAIKYKLFSIAKKYLIEAKKKAYYTFDIDKCNFWLYKITKKKKFLNELTNSKDINIYSLYALDKRHKKLEIKKLKIDNEYIYLVSTKKIPDINALKNTQNKKNNININDPFEWLKILNKINKTKNNELLKLAINFKDPKNLPIFSFILEKYFNYTIHPFIMPYERFLQKNEDKALLYAIARQESRFIPSSISRSFALGSFQIMPFLAKAIAKEKKMKNFDLDLMFNEKINLEFAKYHLNFLKRKLFHPLLIAYAYNGGIGFLKRKVIDKNIFKKDPYLAMELIPYSESRKYGKKVLANYIIYSKIFNKNIDTIKTIDKLVEFDHNHRF